MVRETTTHMRGPYLAKIVFPWSWAYTSTIAIPLHIYVWQRKLLPIKIMLIDAEVICKSICQHKEKGLFLVIYTLSWVSAHECCFVCSSAPAVVCASFCASFFGPIGVEPVNKAWLRKVNSFLPPLRLAVSLCILTSLHPDLIWFAHVVAWSTDSQ